MSETPNEEIRIGLVLLSIVLAWITYQLIERPIRRGTKNKIKTLALVVAMIAIGYIGYNTYHRDGLMFRTIAKQSGDFIYTQALDGYEPCIDEFKTKGVDLGYCIKPANGEASIAIIGDSHAEDKFYGLAEVGQKSSWMLLGNASCPPVYETDIEGSSPQQCKKKFDVIFNYLATNKKIETVFLSFWGNYFKTEFYAADHIQQKMQLFTIKSSTNPSLSNRQELFFQGLDSGIKKLLHSGKKVVLLVDIPELPFSPKDCFRDPIAQCHLSRIDTNNRQEDLRNIIKKLKTSNPDLIVYDPLDLFCDEHSCRYKAENIILYRDSHHITRRGSDLYAEHFFDTTKVLEPRPK